MRAPSTSQANLLFHQMMEDQAELHQIHGLLDEAGFSGYSRPIANLKILIEEYHRLQESEKMLQQIQQILTKKEST